MGDDSHDRAGVRAFLAFEIPNAIRDEIEDHQRRLRERLPRARWVRAANQHLTVKFLGEVSHAILDRLTEGLAPRLATLDGVTISLEGAGFFPSPRRPRVAWLGGRAEGAARVVEAVEAVAEAHGLGRERKPWSLHLTQARLRGPWPPDAVGEFLEWGRLIRFAPFSAGEVVLFSSILQPTGAVYTPLARFPLQ